MTEQEPDKDKIIEIAERVYRTLFLNRHQEEVSSLSALTLVIATYMADTKLDKEKRKNFFETLEKTIEQLFKSQE